MHQRVDPPRLMNLRVDHVKRDADQGGGWRRVTWSDRVVDLVSLVTMTAGGCSDITSVRVPRSGRNASGNTPGNNQIPHLGSLATVCSITWHMPVARTSGYRSGNMRQRGIREPYLPAAARG
jgi:hypothetical protein